MSLTHPRHSTNTAAAPSEPRHLSILLLERSESKPQRPTIQAQLSETSPGQNARLSELPESPVLICSLWLGRRGGDVQQTESCVNRMLPELGPSGVHTGCSPRSHRHPTCSLPVPFAPSTVGRGNTVGGEPMEPNCFLGAGGTRTLGTALAGEEERSRVHDWGHRGKRDASLGAATLQP